MNSIQKKIINLSVISASALLLLSSCSGGRSNDRFKNAHFGDVIEYHKGETYEAKLLNDKFIDVLNGNLGGAGLKPGSEGYDINKNNIIAQFLDESTQKDANNRLALKIAQHNVMTYSFLYNTPGVNAKNDSQDFKHTVSGLLLVPSVAKDQIKGIVLYYHGTESVKNSVPSCIPNADFTKSSSSNLSYCNVNDANFTKQYIAKLAASFAAQGYIVVAPDYIGLGADYKSMHPYVVYPEINAITGLYGVQAGMQILQKENLVNKSQTYKLFLGGYSEGGAYALKASQLAQNSYKDLLSNNSLTIATSAPAEGAYSLSEAQMNFDFEDLTDGLTNKPQKYSSLEFAQTHNDNLLDCSNLPDNDPEQQMKDDPTAIKCLGGSEYQKAVNKWHVGSSLMAALGKPYIVSYAMTAYAYYSLHNLASGYDQLMPREFWSDIPLLDSKLNPTNKHMNILQFFMDPSLKNIDTISLIMHTRNQKYQGRFYNDNIGYIYFNLYQGKKVDDIIPTIICTSDNLPPAIKEICDQSHKQYPLFLPANLLKLSGTGQNNSAGAFVHDNVKNLTLFKKAMEDGDTYKWETNSKIYFISSDYDSIVPSKHSDIAFEYMKNKSNELVHHISLHNFQLTNNSHDLILSAGDNYQSSEYLAPIPSQLAEMIPDAMKELYLPLIAVPIDHTQAEPFTIVGALCAFEQGNANSICKPMK